MRDERKRLGVWRVLGFAHLSGSLRLPTLHHEMAIQNDGTA